MAKAWDVLGGKYRLQQQIGAGATGTVWAAEHIGTRETFALKLITKPTPDVRMRLLRETRACSRLSHPNIVKMHDVGETEAGEPFLVLELLSGETLEDTLKTKRRLDPHFAARVVRDAASALQAAHDAGIIHRDLKPANIFLHHPKGASEEDFVVKVLDFGISKSFEGEEVQATAMGLVIGSPAYMSPEQIGQRGDLDPRTDIWSLGIVLYELLTGARPFSGALEDVVRQVLVAPIPPISSRVRGVPEELDAVVARCLERDRDKRLARASELATLLAPFTEASPMFRASSSLPPRSEARAESSASMSRAEGLSSKERSTADVPAWRLEMQESLAAHRRASMPAAEEVAAGSTGITTTSAPAVAEVVVTTGVAARHKERSKRLLRVAVGLGVAAVLSLLMLVVVGLSGDEPAVVPVAASVTVVPTGVVTPPPVEKVESPPAPVPSPSAAPVKMPVATPVASVAPVGKPSSTYMPLPPCTQTLRVGCRNVGKTAGKGRAASTGGF